jgi:hypothetical protein
MPPLTYLRLNMVYRSVNGLRRVKHFCFAWVLCAGCCASREYAAGDMGLQNEYARIPSERVVFG